MAAVDPAEALNVALERVVEALTPSVQEWTERRRLVDEHIRRLQSCLNLPHPIRITTFGSSLSGFCLATSDIDLGVFGRIGRCPVADLHSQQQKSLLQNVMNAVREARLAQHGKVLPIFGARVPVLKYTCALSGLECDLSLQGSGALLKAHIVHILNGCSPTLSTLYRLVKLWAQVHDLNDASRSTLNSTSLLYMTIFYLQKLQLLPALQELISPQLLRQPQNRPLQGSNKQLWDEPQNLYRLLDAAQDLAAKWSSDHQERQKVPGLGALLSGFFNLYAGALSDWAVGRNRHLHADLWQGTWATGCFERDYIFSIQDPFDPSDCPARAVGISSRPNGGVAAFIAFLASSSSKVMDRYVAKCKRSSAAEESAIMLADMFSSISLPAGLSENTNGVAAIDPASPKARQNGRIRHDSGEWVIHESSLHSSPEQVHVCRQHQELCKVLVWLFGPQAVLLLGSQQRHLAQVNPSHLPPWVQCPFHHSVVTAVHKKLQSKCDPGTVLTWLVNQFDAALDPERNVLCLDHLSLLTWRITTATTVVTGKNAAGRARAKEKFRAKAEPASTAANGEAATAGVTATAVAVAAVSHHASTAAEDHTATAISSSHEPRHFNKSSSQGDGQLHAEHIEGCLSTKSNSTAQAACLQVPAANASAAVAPAKLTAKAAIQAAAAAAAATRAAAATTAAATAATTAFKAMAKQHGKQMAATAITQAATSAAGGAAGVAAAASVTLAGVRRQQQNVAAAGTDDRLDSIGSDSTAAKQAEVTGQQAGVQQHLVQLMQPPASQQHQQQQQQAQQQLAKEQQRQQRQQQTQLQQQAHQRPPEQQQADVQQVRGQKCQLQDSEGPAYLHGPPLPFPDTDLLDMQQLLQAELDHLQRTHRIQLAGVSPKRHPKAVTKLVRYYIRDVMHRLQHIENVQQDGQQGSALAGSSNSSTNNGSCSARCSEYGLMAVLEQHQFTPLLQQWNMVNDGVLWRKLLPNEHDSILQGRAAAAAVSMESTLAVEPAATGQHDAVATLVAAGASASGSPTNSSSSWVMLKQLLGNTDPVKLLRRLYVVLGNAAKPYDHPLPPVPGADKGPEATEAVGAACPATNTPADAVPKWQFGQPKFAHIQWGPEGLKQCWYAVARLPPITQLHIAADGGVVVQIITQAHNVAVPLQRERHSKEAIARIAAKAAISWLAQQPGVVEAVANALQVCQQQEQQSQPQLSQHQQQMQQPPQLPGSVQQQDFCMQLSRGKAPIKTRQLAQQSMAASAEQQHTTTMRLQQQQQQHTAKIRLGPCADAAIAAVGAAVQHGASDVIAVDPQQQAAAAAKQLKTQNFNITLLKQRIVNTQAKLLEAEQYLEELEDKEDAALQAAKQVCNGGGSNGSAGRQPAVGCMEPADAHAADLLGLALQQSLDEQLKGLREDIHSATRTVKDRTASLKQLTANLVKLQQEAAALEAAIAARQQK